MEPGLGVAATVLGRVGVVGAGTMGAGIAQVALEAGHEVALFDVADGAVDRARTRIADGLARRAARRGPDERLAADWVAGRLAVLRAAHSLEDVAAGTVLVVEAAVEDLVLKRVLFAALDRAADDGTILATNTSALPVASIAAETSRPGRVLGLHFFNPAPVMPLVEVVVAPGTEPDVADRAEALVRGWGKTPVRCADLPGFIVNRVNRPFTLEPLRLLEEGVATVTEIDAAIRAAGFPQGPFEHIDLVGLDVNLASSRSIHAALGRPARLAPSGLQERLVTAGRLGRKSGAGFYEYDATGRPVRPSPEFARRGRRPTAVTQRDGVRTADRVRLALANEAFFALDDDVATADRIDLALRLGAAHPQGPIEWARARGLRRVRDELLALVASEGDRFAPAPSLDPEAVAAQ